MALQTRAEAKKEFTWDFSGIFQSEEAWEAAYAKAEKDIEKIHALEGTLGTSADSMKAALDTITQVTHDVEIVYLYASLHMRT